jgi:hypothetical protein
MGQDADRPRVERRLAAILATDVVGYSRLMGVDEEGTLARLKAHRREQSTMARIAPLTPDALLAHENAPPSERVPDDIAKHLRSRRLIVSSPTSSMTGNAIFCAAILSGPKNLLPHGRPNMQRSVRP